MSLQDSPTRKSTRNVKTSVEHTIEITLESDDDDDSSQRSRKVEPQTSATAKLTESISSNPDLSASSSFEVFSETELPVKNTVCANVKRLDISEQVDPSPTERKPTTDGDTKEEIPTRGLPPYNVPEQIIIVLDRAKDEICSSFELTNGKKFTPLQMLKHVLLFFLTTKNVIDKKHKYALVVLNENSASWVHDFTNDVDALISAFDDIEECETEDIFNLNCVFDLIMEKVKLCPVETEPCVPPRYVTRVVFIYGRSITLPELAMTEKIEQFLNTPTFTFDVLMTHEVPDSSNKCQLIFKRLQELDTKGFAYFFNVSRSAHELHLSFAKLLGHPLQRPCQKFANYKLNCNG